MRISLLSLLAALPLAACTGKGDDTGGPDAHDSTNDTDSHLGACGAYMSGVGSVLTYSFTAASQMTGTSVVTFTSLDSASGDAVFTSITDIASAQYTSSSTTIQNMRCQADGIFDLSSTTDYSVVASGTSFGGTTETTYGPPMLVLPADVAVGSNWDMSTDGTTTDSNAGSSTFSISQTAAVTGAESVTVPAGTYDTLAITYTPSSGDPSHAWIAAGVGTVKSDTTELSAAH